MVRRERWVVVATLALLQIFVVVAGGYVIIHGLTRPTPAPIASPEPAPTPIITAGPVLASAGDGILPAKGTLTSRLRSAMGTPGLGPSVAGVVLDARTGEVLFDGGATKPITPASATKVVTAAAVLASIGPDARFVTRVVRGKAKNSIVLVGGGDPTLAGPRRGKPRGYPQPASLAQLASRTAKALKAEQIAKVELSYDASLFDGPAMAAGWKPNYIPEGSVAPVAALTMDEGRTAGGGHLADPPRQTAAAFAALLERNGIKVGGKIGPVDKRDSVVLSGADRDDAGPNGAGQDQAGTELARVESPPAYALVERMLTLSDNDLAEALARHVAVKEGMPRTFAGGAAAIRKVLARLNLDQGIEIHDGSGLSTRNRITPAALGRLLAAAASPGNPRLNSLISGLPVAGFTGTLHDRYTRSDSAAGAGLVRAKTGTLNGVNTLAGISYTADGRLLTFAFMADAVTDPDRAVAALDKMATIVSQS